MRYTRWAFTERILGLGLALACGAAAGCGASYQGLRAGSFERGQAAFEEENYAEAIQDLKLFIRRSPTDELADDAQFYVGRANYEAGDFPLAAVEFQILRADYPSSELFEHAYYLEGMCYVEQTPSLDVDPAVVEEGIAHFQRFLRDFPDGEYSDQAREQLRNLRLHMDRKRLQAAELYRRMGQSEAALVTVQSILQDNPDSELAPDLLLLRGDLALKIRDFSQAREAWTRLVERYPDHALADAAQRRLAKLGTVAGGTNP